VRAVLWAINGKGIGHTARMTALGRQMMADVWDSTIIIESPSQETYLKRSVLSDTPRVIIQRPWRVSSQEKQYNEQMLSIAFADCDVLVADLGGVPKFENLSHLGLPSLSIFLLRWMTNERWTRLLTRLAEYPQKGIVCFVCVPQELFLLWAGIEHDELANLRHQIRFLDGFVFNSSDNAPDIKYRLDIAFTCGLGGVHGTNGQRELEELLSGTILVAKSNPNIEADAWVGNNADLFSMASNAGCFRRIYRFNDGFAPVWNQYCVVVGRCSVNTFAEIMNSATLFLTAACASDGEWTTDSLRLLSPYGVWSVDAFEAKCVAESITRLLVRYNDESRQIEMVRKASFPNASRDLALQISLLAQQNRQNSGPPGIFME